MSGSGLVSCRNNAECRGRFQSRSADRPVCLGKFQTPSSKLQGSSRLQTPMLAPVSWSLKFGASLELGIWSLEFHQIAVQKGTGVLQRCAGLDWVRRRTYLFRLAEGWTSSRANSISAQRKGYL